MSSELQDDPSGVVRFALHGARQAPWTRSEAGSCERATGSELVRMPGRDKMLANGRGRGPGMASPAPASREDASTKDDAAILSRALAAVDALIARVGVDPSAASPKRGASEGERQVEGQRATSSLVFRGDGDVVTAPSFRSHLGSSSLGSSPFQLPGVGGPLAEGTARSGSPPGLGELVGAARVAFSFLFVGATSSGRGRRSGWEQLAACMAGATAVVDSGASR